jgi:hypothetical protein
LLARRAGASLAVGGINGVTAGAATIGAFSALYLGLDDFESAPQEVRVALAVLTYVVPLAAGAMAFLALMFVFDQRWGANLAVSAGFGGLLVGALLIYMTLLISAVNACELDVAFPVAAYGDACDQ